MLGSENDAWLQGRAQEVGEIPQARWQESVAETSHYCHRSGHGGTGCDEVGDMPVLPEALEWGPSAAPSPRPSAPARGLSCCTVLLVCQAGSGVSAGGGSDSGRPPRASREVAVCVCVGGARLRREHKGLRRSSRLGEKVT